MKPCYSWIHVGWVALRVLCKGDFQKEMMCEWPSWVSRCCETFVDGSTSCKWYWHICYQSLSNAFLIRFLMIWYSLVILKDLTWNGFYLGVKGWLAPVCDAQITSRHHQGSIPSGCVWAPQTVVDTRPGEKPLNHYLAFALSSLYVLGLGVFASDC